MPTPRSSFAARVAGAPWLPRSYLPRPALWSRLDTATTSAVTVLVAPAGAGKTLGAAGWLEASGEAGALWLDATRTTSTRVLQEALDGPGADGRPRLVVIDDAHHLTADCTRLIEERIGTDPSSLRLLLLTRWDLGLARLMPQLLGQLSVIRGDVLILTGEETTQLVADHAGFTDPGLTDAIMSRADGWCAAVVLAARAGAASPNRAAFTRRVEAAGTVVADLVAGEVFAGLTSAERHLLLCTASEPHVSAAVARHVTRDPRAGEVLSGLGATGLLVLRIVGSDPEVGDPDPHFRIHPLLLEVVRRRLAAGGVDVRRAHATVLHAARLDLVGGRTGDAFRRLVALGEHEAAAALLSEGGPRLVAKDEGDDVARLVRDAGLVLAAQPETWCSIAWSRYERGDLAGGRHWADLLLRHAEQAPAEVPDLHRVTLQLRRSRDGVVPVGEAAREAAAVLASMPGAVVRDPHLPWALLELGVAQNWLGDLPAAAEVLTRALQVSRADDLVTTTAQALSHLALNQLQEGREQSARTYAVEALALCDQHDLTAATTRGRAELVLGLVNLQSAAPVTRPRGGQHAPPPVTDDLASQFWRRVLDSRTALLGGAVVEAQRRVEMPLESPRLPRHLRVTWLMERARLSVITMDRVDLRQVAHELAALSASAEQLWVLGALADLDGDLPQAVALYDEASEAPSQRQPTTTEVALVCAAQLHDHLGDTAASTMRMARALHGTEARRVTTPFLGWSRHGTRVGVLLTRRPAPAADWVGYLCDAFAGVGGVASVYAPFVATARELATVSEPALAPVLSPREREVLNELARGSSYADIAANLYVSENTVKTHVSSLYSKLAVGRRSEALALARKMHLL